MSGSAKDVYAMLAEAHAEGKRAGRLEALRWARDLGGTLLPTDREAYCERIDAEIARIEGGAE